MSGFFQKLRLVTLGTAHDLLDKEIDMNSPLMLRQYVRDLEDAIGKMNSEAAIQVGQVRTMKREYGDLGAKIEADKQQVKSLLASSPDLARSKAALVVENQKHYDQMSSDIEAQQKVADDLTQSVLKLQSKHDLMVSRVRELERIDRDSKTKESAAAAMTAAGSLIGGVGTQSIDDLEGRMRNRNDVASAKFDQAMAATATPDDEANSEDVDALLTSLKGA